MKKTNTTWHNIIYWFGTAVQTIAPFFYRKLHREYTGKKWKKSCQTEENFRYLEQETRSTVLSIVDITRLQQHKHTRCTYCSYQTIRQQTQSVK